MPKLVNVNKKSVKGAAVGKGAKSGKDSPLPEEMDVDLESLGSCDPLDPEKNSGEDKDKLIDRWLDGKKGEKSDGGDGEKSVRKKRKRGAKSDEEKSDSGGKRADDDGQLKLPAESKKQKSAQPAEQMSAEQMQALALQTMGMQAMGMNPVLMTMRGLHLPQPDPQMISQMQGMDPLNMMEKSRECLMQATQSRAPNPTGFHCRVVMLGLPPGIGTKLGLVMEDSKEFIGMPELKQVLPSSPVITQIPPQFRQGCCVASLKSDKIGHATPKTAKEAVELINKSRCFGMQNLIRLEMLLIQTKVTTAPQPNPELRDMRLQASRAAMAPGLLPSQPQVSTRPVGTGGLLKDVERRTSPRKTQQTTSYSNYKDWNLHYEALVEYTHLYGNCDVRASTHPVLAQWCLGQRASAHKLTKSRRERLEKVGFWALPANPKQSRAPSKPSEPRGPFPEPTWDERYDSLVRFRDKCGLLPTSGSLSEWIEEQKKEAERLSQNQCVKLYGSGVDLGLPRERLEEMGIEFADDREANAGGIHWWQSPEARNLFGSEWGEHVHVVTMLQERVALLRKANESVAGWKSLVPDDGKEELYNENDILTVRHKAQYLSRAYLLAIEKMPIMKWSNCCAAASKELMALGLSKAGGDLIRRWNLGFRVEELFPHPGRLTREKKQGGGTIFDYFPNAKEQFIEIANANIQQMSSVGVMTALDTIVEQFSARVIPELERDSREKGCFDDGSSAQKSLKKLTATPPTTTTIRRWLKQLNIEYDRQVAQRGKGTSYLAQRMKEAWASGKYSNRRPKGQGLKRGKQAADAHTVKEQAGEFEDEV